MARYIDADKLPLIFGKAINEFEGTIVPLSEVAIKIGQTIRNLPTADVEEVKHGEWIEEVVKIPCAWDEGGYETQINYVCSECGFVNDLGKTNGCPECLAKMEGGKEE